MAFINTVFSSFPGSFNKIFPALKVSYSSSPIFTSHKTKVLFPDIEDSCNSTVEGFVPPVAIHSKTSGLFTLISPRFFLHSNVGYVGGGLTKINFVETGSAVSGGSPSTASYLISVRIYISFGISSVFGVKQTLWPLFVFSPGSVNKPALSAS